MSKPVLAIVFDGVLHVATRTSPNPETIEGPPVEGSRGFIHRVGIHFEITVVGWRCSFPTGAMAVKAWCKDKYGELCEDWLFRGTDNRAHIRLDPAALRFSGAWPSLASLTSRPPWWSRSGERSSPVPEAFRSDSKALGLAFMAGVAHAEGDQNADRLMINARTALAEELAERPLL